MRRYKEIKDYYENAYKGSVRSEMTPTIQDVFDLIEEVEVSIKKRKTLKNTIQRVKRTRKKTQERAKQLENEIKNLRSKLNRPTSP